MQGLVPSSCRGPMTSASSTSPLVFTPSSATPAPRRNCGRIPSGLDFPKATTDEGKILENFIRLSAASSTVTSDLVDDSVQPHTKAISKPLSAEQHDLFINASRRRRKFDNDQLTPSATTSFFPNIVHRSFRSGRPFQSPNGTDPTAPSGTWSPSRTAPRPHRFTELNKPRLDEIADQDYANMEHVQVRDEVSVRARPQLNRRQEANVPAHAHIIDRYLTRPDQPFAHFSERLDPGPRWESVTHSHISRPLYQLRRQVGPHKTVTPRR